MAFSYMKLGRELGVGRVGFAQLVERSLSGKTGTKARGVRGMHIIRSQLRGAGVTFYVIVCSCA